MQGMEFKLYFNILPQSTNTLSANTYSAPANIDEALVNTNHDA